MGSASTVLVLVLCACGTVASESDAAPTSADGAGVDGSLADAPPGQVDGAARPDGTPCVVPSVTFAWWHHDCAAWGCAAEGGATDFTFYLNGVNVGGFTEVPSCDQECPGYTSSFQIPEASVLAYWRGDGTDVLRFTKDAGGNFYYLYAVVDWGAAGSLRNCYVDRTDSDCSYGCAYDYGYHCGSLDSVWIVTESRGGACL